MGEHFRLSQPGPSWSGAGQGSCAVRSLGRALKRRPRSGRMLPYPPRFVFLVVRRNSTSATYEGVIALLRVNLLYKRRCFCLVLIARGSISYTWMNTSDTDS